MSFSESPADGSVQGINVSLVSIDPEEEQETTVGAPDGMQALGNIALLPSAVPAPAVVLIGQTTQA